MRGPVPGRRCDAVDSLDKGTAPEGKWEGKRVLHIGWSQPSRGAGGARVDRVLAGRHVIDQAQFPARCERSIRSDELPGDRQTFLDRDGRLDPGVLAGAVEPPDVILHPVGFLAEGPHEIRHGGAEDDPQVIHRQHALRRRNILAFQVSQGFVHPVLLPPTLALSGARQCVREQRVVLLFVSWSLIVCDDHQSGQLFVSSTVRAAIVHRFSRAGAGRKIGLRERRR